MDMKDFIPKKKVKGIVGFQVSQVNGTNEKIIAVFMLPSMCKPVRVSGELVLDPIIREVEVPIWDF